MTKMLDSNKHYETSFHDQIFMTMLWWFVIKDDDENYGNNDDNHDVDKMVVIHDQ